MSTLTEHAARLFAVLLGIMFVLVCAGCSGPLRPYDFNDKNSNASSGTASSSGSSTSATYKSYVIVGRNTSNNGNQILTFELDETTGALLQKSAVASVGSDSMDLAVYKDC